MLSPGDWTVLNVIDYLVREESSLTAEDLSSLRSSKTFKRECLQGGGQEDTHHCAAELYPPLDIFRKLRLPVIEWSRKSGWTETSSEGELNVIHISFIRSNRHPARLLYRLGLNQLPPLPKIVDLCSSKDPGVQETAFVYLCSNLLLQYLKYEPEDFCDTEFIPAESMNDTGLRKLGEVRKRSLWTRLTHIHYRCTAILSGKR